MIIMSNIVLKNVRLSYEHVFTPVEPLGGGEPKYSASLIIDKKVPFYDKANGVWCAMTGGTQNHVEKKVNQNELTESNKKIEAARSSVLNAASSHNEISSAVEDLPF